MNAKSFENLQRYVSVVLEAENRARCECGVRQQNPTFEEENNAYLFRSFTATQS